MPEIGFTRPTLRELTDRVRGDLSSRIEGTDARLRRALLRVLGTVLGGMWHIMHGYAQWIARQIHVRTCDPEMVPVHGGIHGVEQLPAEAASGPVTFTGTNGSVVPAGTLWQRADGATFATDAEATMGVAGTLDIDCTATDEGADGNCDAGVTGQLVSPVTGISNSVVVAADGIGGGVDVENAEHWRERIVEHIQAPAHGGSDDDYQGWVREVSGVDRVWVDGNGAGSGSVVIRFTVVDGPIPSGTQVDAVQAYVEPLAPVTARIVTLQLDALDVDYEVALDPDSAELRAAVVDELDRMHATEAVPGGTLERNDMIGAIRNATKPAGATFDLVAPAADVVAGANELAIRGAMTWS